MDLNDIPTKELIEELKKRRYIKSYVATEDVKIRDNKEGKSEAFGNFTVLVIDNNRVK